MSSLQALRQTQLSASIAHARAQQDAREPSRGLSSASRKSQLSKAANLSIDGSDYKAALREVATKILILCVPWSNQWVIHGVWIVSAATGEEPRGITGMDRLGNEILSHIPHHLVGDFLSETGQSLVSLI